MNQILNEKRKIRYLLTWPKPCCVIQKILWSLVDYIPIFLAFRADFGWVCFSQQLSKVPPYLCLVLYKVEILGGVLLLVPFRVYPRAIGWAQLATCGQQCKKAEGFLAAKGHGNVSGAGSWGGTLWGGVDCPEPTPVLGISCLQCYL